MAAFFANIRLMQVDCALIDRIFLIHVWVVTASKHDIFINEVISAYLISAPDVLQIRVGSFRVEIADDEENDGDKLDCERDDGTRDHLAFWRVLFTSRQEFHRFITS